MNESKNIFLTKYQNKTMLKFHCTHLKQDKKGVT